MNAPNTRASDSSGSSISSSLLLQVRAHDADAWRRMVRIYGPVVYQWCSRAGLRGEDAADIGQEVFRAVADRIATFQRSGEGGTFGGWLRVITRNKIADFYRRMARNPQAVGGLGFQQYVAHLPQRDVACDTDDGDAESLKPIVYRRALQIIRNEFEETTWQAFWATAIEGRTSRDVAADLEMTAMAVRKAKSRVLRRLRDEFNGEIDD